jgi:hypothetical protein
VDGLYVIRLLGEIWLHVFIAVTKTERWLTVIELMDMTGRTVHVESAVIIKGWVQKPITLPPTLDNGVYMVTVRVNNEVYRAKLVYAHGLI